MLQYRIILILYRIISMLLNQPQSKLGQTCVNSEGKIDRQASDCATFFTHMQRTHSFFTPLQSPNRNCTHCDLTTALFCREATLNTLTFNKIVTNPVAGCKITKQNQNNTKNRPVIKPLYYLNNSLVFKCLPSEYSRIQMAFKQPPTIQIGDCYNSP